MLLFHVSFLYVSINKLFCRHFRALVSVFHHVSGVYGFTRGKTELISPLLMFFKGEQAVSLQQVQTPGGRNMQR